MKELSILEQLCFCTTRIEAVGTDDHILYGTGFFYLFPTIAGEGCGFVYLITNKHLILNAKEIKFAFSKQNSNGDPIYEPPVFQLTGMPNEILYHPNDDIDLCAIPITMFIKVRESMGQKIFLKNISYGIIPTKEQWDSLEPVEDILLIGYPNALWDERNNMPLIRKGITATAPYLDYNGKRKFVIDAACFPGSSGSPVFIYNNGTYRDKKSNSIVMGTRLYFLGILYGGPRYTVKGKLMSKGNIANMDKIKSQAAIPTNLGYVIKSDVLYDFIPLVEAQTKTKIIMQ